MKRLSLLLLALLMAGCSNIVIEGQFLAPADVTATALADSTRASPTSTSDLAATAIEGAVRLTLTAAIPSPTDTPPPSPTAEPTTAIPPTDTPVPTATKKPAIQPSAPPPSPTPGEKDPFVGNWFAFDTVDGSSTILTITRSNGSYSLVLVDDRASACGLDEASKPKFAIEIRAAGTARGNVLQATTT